jgi:ubiquinone/menaquinone biosynthesis C-methylase UbiE
MLLLEPKLKVRGFDISEYGINSATELVKPHLFLHQAQSKYAFANNEFDLVISLGALHNLRLFHLKSALSEIERVGKHAYVMLESYRNEQELFNLQCWALTCESFFDEEEWVWLYKQFGYFGDYEFIYF